MLVGAELD
jgi:vesicle transport through interaction with t-SNAREs 1